MKKRKIILTILVMFNIASFLLYYKYIILTDPNEIKKYQIGTNEENKPQEYKEVEKEMYNIYIPDVEGENLITQSIEMEKDLDIRKKIETIFEYIKTNSNGFISMETSLYNVYIKSSDVYLNISSNLSRYMDSPEKEQIIIYSIINSICELEDVKRVKILIDNQNVRELGGYIDISDYFEADKLLIKGE